ncbi:MAG: hypothetical protein Q6361_05175 [Candidatus Hermodarchaeota archaeon]|nr:hypothetical protein [Candidatus Hermodarchaeota archaeon]
MSRQAPALFPSQATLILCLLVILFPISGSNAQLQYGYEVGDVYSFTDSIIETFEANSTHLYEEISHSFQVHIQDIAENASYNSIVITVKVLNLSAGLVDYIQSVIMEGCTFIVASPYVYFTHTQWDLHVIDFLDSAENYQQATQMTGSVEHNQNERYFHWNLSKFISASVSPYDTDEDGQMDAYTVISMYSARFTEEGVIEERVFFTENRFTNGALYHRNRHITLDANLSMPGSPLTLIVIGLVVVTMVMLIVLTLFLYRRPPVMPQTRT